MKKLVLAGLVISGLFAGDPFGVKLGDDFKNYKVIGKSETTSGETLYQIKAPKPVKNIKKYYTLVTPKTKKVYAVWAMKGYKDLGKCKKDVDNFKLILEKKYGKFKSLIAFMGTTYIHIDNNTTIVDKCDGGIGESVLYLQYTNKLLEEQADEETAEIKAEKNGWNDSL